MAIGIALAAEEHGKIVSARHFCNAVKSYLPTHGTFHKIAHWALCIFADAIRKECAEAKDAGNNGLVQGVDAIRKECAEAKIGSHDHFLCGLRRNSQGVHRGKAPGSGAI